MTNDPQAEDRAKGRFFTLIAVRLAGVVMALFGLYIIAGKIDLPMLLGYVLFANGLFDALIVPGLLAKRWKSRGE